MCCCRKYLEFVKLMQNAHKILVLLYKGDIDNYSLLKDNVNVPKKI